MKKLNELKQLRASKIEAQQTIMDGVVDRNINNDEVAFKMARAYATMNEDKKAKKIIDSILKKQPNNKVFIKLKKSLK